jgi:hypothetical protein
VLSAELIDKATGRVINTSDEHRETSVLDLEVREDGGLRLFCGGASTTRLGGGALL